MSRKSRERRERYKTIQADDYFSNGTFEISRFGTQALVKNNRTAEQLKAYMDYLQAEYPTKYENISQKISELKEKVLQSNPYNLLMYLRQTAFMLQINIFSEFEYTKDANAIMRAQEYVQSILVSAEGHYQCSMTEDMQETIYEQIIDDFNSLYAELQTFYFYWAAYIQKTTEISDDQLNTLVEAQYMYWVRGNRYQVFELEPLKKLLPPHNSVLMELFGISANEIINGLEKLQYTLSQGYADTLMELGKEYQNFTVAVAKGIDAEKAIRSRTNHVNKILDKLGGADLIDVKSITGWDNRFIQALTYQLGECHSFLNESIFSGWPIVELPVMRKPFIKINGIAYAFLYYALFDNIYRNIQKSVTQLKPEYKESWKNKQTEASEEMVASLFSSLLPGAEVHIGNYYPVNTSLKKMNENDIIITYMNHLFIVEVKAGSFPSTPPLTDFQAHISAYQKLAEAADSQCSRTLSYISRCSPAQFYDHDKNAKFCLPNPESFDAIFTFSVTIDNFNAFAAKAEKTSIISLKEKTIVISYDDLLAYKGYFTSPISFLHFLKQRQAAISVPQYQLSDELDHLGLYIEKNLYTLEPSPFDVHRVVPFGFRQDLDKYFGLLFLNSAASKKPVQNIPKEVSEIIQILENDITLENIRLAHFLLDLSSDAKEDLGKQISYALCRQKELGRTVPISRFGEIKYCVFISMPNIRPFTISEQLDYSYAAASRNETVPVFWISLEYDDTDILISAQGKNCFFSDLKGADIERLKNLGNLKAKDWIKLYKQSHKKIGRNDICPCGSGKKYKFCCLGNE